MDSTSVAAKAGGVMPVGGVEHWCGEFDYPSFASRAPMNISIAGATAAVNQVWDRKAHGCHSCCPEAEAGLKVTRSATQISFLGDGSATQYYSFEASFNSAGDKMAGNISSEGRTYGNFTAQKNGCPEIQQNCTPGPKPPPPPPGPTPPPPPHPPVPVWPLPLQLNCTPAVSSAASKLLASTVTVKLTGAGASSPVAVQAAARYQLLLRKAGSAAGPVTLIMVEVEEANETLGQDTNYSYSLHYAAAAGTTVSSSVASPFGLGYACETLLQLASPKAQLDCGGGFAVLDRPAYKHRGLLLDTGRRFFPLALLESTIDAMSIFKLNVLHLHLNEDKFRVESRIFPQLNQPQNCSECQYYSQDEVKSLVQFAHLRGIRVIPEFELLAHATALCNDLKSEGIVCCHGKWGMGQLGDDPSGNTTRILSALLTEMAALFPDVVLHIGGDEAQYGTTGPCTIAASKSLEQKVMKKVAALGKQPMGWQEILLETGAATSIPGAIIETWSKAGLWAQTGHPAVEALPSSLYLNGAATSAGYVHGSYRPGVWLDITSGALNASNAHLMLGGEASMWTDQYLGTKHNIDHRTVQCLLPSPASDVEFGKSISAVIWPRAAVAAGSFWRWDGSLSPQTQPEVFASVVAEVNGILTARGVDTCPCANATWNGCDATMHCNVTWCNQTA
jgi:hexosaminidase